MQNVAKHRAQEFGRSDVLHAIHHRDSSSDGRAVEEPVDSIVVTSTATEAEVRGLDASPNDELGNKPRGFFADQFEVDPHTA